MLEPGGHNCVMIVIHLELAKGSFSSHGLQDQSEMERNGCIKVQLAAAERTTVLLSRQAQQESLRTAAGG